MRYIFVTSLIAFFGVASGCKNAGNVERSAGPMVERSYDVKDLLFIPANNDIVPDLTVPTPESNLFDRISKREFRQTTPGREPVDELRQYLIDNVDNSSWQERQGSIVADAGQKKLRITQTEAVQAKVQAALDNLRHRREVQVSVQFRLFSINDDQERHLTAELQQRLRSVRGYGHDRTDVFLTTAEFEDLVHATNTGAMTNSLRGPRMNLFDGQHGALVICAQQAFKTAASQNWASTQPSDQAVDVMCTTATGLTIQVAAAVSPDHSKVTLDLNGTMVRLLLLLHEQLHADRSTTIDRPVHSVRRFSMIGSIPDGSLLLLGCTDGINAGDLPFNDDSPSHIATLAAIENLRAEQLHQHVYIVVSPKVHIVKPTPSTHPAA